MFAKWLMDKFQSFLFKNCNGVLDIAGGKGVVSYYLCRSQIKCTVVDPMPLKLSSNKTKEIMSEYLYDNDGENLNLLGENNFLSMDDFLINQMKEDFRLSWLDPETYKEKLQKINAIQEVKKFINLVKNNLEKLNLKHQRILFTQNCSTCHNLVNESSFLIGFHPDQATEDIVDLSLKYNKPFAIVPCCVFPSLFPNRKGIDGKPVRTFEQFLDYLQNKNPKIQREIIDTLSPPNNICLFYYE